MVTHSASKAGVPTKATAVITEKSSFFKDKKRHIYVAAIIICIVVLCFALWFGGVFSSNKVCSDEILNSADKVLVPSEVRSLEPIANQIQSLPDYDKDPNCLGIVATYFISSGQPTEARTQYELLVQIYDDQAGYSQIIEGNVKSPAEMKPAIEFLEKQKENVNSNRILGPELQ